MEMVNNITIPTTTLNAGFKEFLDVENNKRIFFSGKFGIGKTFFWINSLITILKNMRCFTYFQLNIKSNLMKIS